MIHKLIYQAGMRVRNPSLTSQLEALLESEHWSYHQLKNLQLKRLQELLIFAEANSPFYTALFNKYRFNPRELQSVEDLKQLPIIDKSTLIIHNKDIQSRASFKKLRLSETSGTTGQPLAIYRSEEWDSGHRAAMFRGYHWYNVNPWDRNGYFWGYNIDPKEAKKIKFLDSLQNRFRLFSYSEEEIEKFCNELKKATFLSGYSSMIYEVAKKISSMGLSQQFPHLKMIKGTSEKIFPSYQKEVQKAFGLKMISEYGSMESGIIAYECPEEGNMHIAMENVVVEVENGEIIVTNLLSHSFPIIRYKLGDAVVLAPENYKCPCGRHHPIILDIQGRVGKPVIGKLNSYPSLTFYYVFKNITLKTGVIANYQAIQNEKGKVLLRIEQSHNEILDRLIKEQLNAYFKNDIVFEIKYGEKLHAMNGKLKDFIQNIESI